MSPTARYLISRTLALALLALAVAAAGRFVATTRGVADGAMLPTLWPGDRLIVARYAAGGAAPRRGDVVVARTGGGERIGRVIGLPGERVEVRRGIPVLNGDPLPRYRVADLVLPGSVRCPVAETRRGRTAECRVERYRETAPDGRAWDVLDLEADGDADAAPATVPAGGLLLLSDNRDRSRAATVPVAAVIGHAVTIAWSGDGTATWRRFWRWGGTLRPGRIMKGVERTPADG